ncbi:MAG: hypothetical protein M0P91_13400 [Sulfuricurvum sp.]|jgi:hypothetical protein|uniref:hypothetical protein n=1 Tax=Sulfuricurvum sp. TaxID=2025608 RepID=UPI0025D4C511|nr:hypothetical protein [Sulfuricurvum sp.]MCK9374172.1 hypothetical protein [Sulfuricurvum sp.]
MIKRSLGLLFLLPLGLLAAQLTQLKTHIELRAEPLPALPALISTFNTLGYKIQIDSLSRSDSVIQIEAVLVGLKPFNSATLTEHFQENGMKLTHGRVNQGKLELAIDAMAAVWNVPLLNADEGMELQRSSAPYWFRVEPGQVVSIQAPYGGKWYPDISVLDGSMQLLSNYRSEKNHDDFKLPLPEGAYYLKISNTNGMKALKEGMWVESMSEGR